MPSSCPDFFASSKIQHKIAVNLVFRIGCSKLLTKSFSSKTLISLNYVKEKAKEIEKCALGLGKVKLDVEQFDRFFKSNKFFGTRCLVKVDDCVMRVRLESLVLFLCHVLL